MSLLVWDEDRYSSLLPDSETEPEDSLWVSRGSSTEEAASADDGIQAGVHIMVYDDTTVYESYARIL